MKPFSHALILFAGILISLNSNSQNLSGAYSIGSLPSSPGQFPNFTGPLNSVGTISCNTDTALVMGYGTAFTKTFQPGDNVYDAGGWVNGNLIGQVDTIISDNQLTLTGYAAETLTTSAFCGPEAPCAFAAINAYGLRGSVILTLNADVMEPGTNSLKKWMNIGGTGYSVSINCYWGNTIDGSNVPANAAGVIRLDGCSNVNIVGGDPWGNNLTFRNENNKGADIAFVNGASFDTIGPAITFENQNTNTVAGTNVGAVFFGTTSGTTGNSNILLTGCSIRNRSDTTLTAHEGIYSQGTSQYPNSNNSIIGCDFDNLENYGIWITGNGNGSGWKIEGSSFHWDDVTPATTNQAGIYFNAGASSSSDSITGNYIGRDGPPYWYGEWINNGASGFIGIFVNTGTKGVTNVSGNYVAHVQMTNFASTYLYGIQAAGGWLNVDSNNLGDPQWLYTGPQNTLRLSGTGTLAAIYAIGAGGSALNINGNQVYAMTRYLSTTGAASDGQLIGIGVANSVSAPVNIIGNTVEALTDSGSWIGVGNLSSVCGIYDYGTAIGHNIYRNNISDLENMYVGTNVINLTGIALSGPATNTAPYNICARNNIYIDGTCRNGATLQFANIAGVDIQGAAFDVVNNAIMLGYDEFWYADGNPYIISGIKKSTAVSAIDNIYFNSVFIVGSSNSATTRNTYCYNASGAANTADVIKNNVFFNARNNTGSAGNHYAMYYNPANIFDNNDYLATGTGGLLSNGNNSIPLKAGQDANSLSVDPDFLEEHCQPCPWDNLHLNTGCALHGKGVDLSKNTPAFTEDFDGNPRANPPFIGCSEFNYVLSISPNSPVNVCAGSPTTLSVGGFCPNATYAWSPATGLSATDISNPVASPSVTTTYTVAGTDVGGFTSSDTVVVSVGISITVAPMPTYCTSDSVAGVAYKTAGLPYSVTTGNPDEFSIVWNTAAHTAGFKDVTNKALPTSAIVFNVPTGVSGSYNGTVSVTNTSNGCVSTGVPFTLVIVAGVPKNLAVVATPSAPPHQGDKVILVDSIDPNYPVTSYAWFHWLSPVGEITTFSDTLIKDPVVYNGTGISGAGVTWIEAFGSNACGSSDPSGFYIYQVVPTYTLNNPTLCDTSGGSIVFTGLNPSGFEGYVGDYDISYSYNGVPQTTIESLTTDSMGNETWANLPAGIYTNIQLYWARNGHSCGCVSPSAPVDTIKLTIQSCDSIPSITLGNNPQVCSSSKSQTANLIYSSANQNPDEYEISWGSTALTAGFANVAFAAGNLTSSPIAISVPAGVSANTYTGTLTVRNSVKAITGIGHPINVIVNPLPSISATSFSICNGNSAAAFNATCTLNCGSNVSYNWSPSLTLSSDTGANPSASPSVSTTYTITGTNSYNCTVTTTATVTVNNTVTPSLNITTNHDTICGGTTVLFFASPLNGGTSPAYQWMKNGLDVGTDSSGYFDNGLANNDIISCTMTSSASCASDSIATSNAISIAVSGAANAGTLATTEDTICSGTPTIISVSGSSGAIHWQSSSTPSKFKTIVGATKNSYTAVFSQTTYFRVYTTNGACSDTSEILKLTTVSAPLAVFTDSVSGMQVSFNSSGSVNAVSFYWDFGDNTTSTLANPIHAYDSVKTYDVCLTVKNFSNCNYTSCLNVLTYPTGINNVSSLGEVKIYPNPFTSTIIIEQGLISNSTETVEVYNLLGEMVYSKVYNAPGKVLQVELPDLPGSMYIVKLRTAGADYLQPLIKQ